MDQNLPQPEYGKFVGRDRELEKVFELLRPYPRSRHHLIVIDGVGGIGKSSLALQVARLCLDASLRAEEGTQDANRSSFLSSLRRSLVDRFDEEELRTLCFDMALDYDVLPGRGMEGKTRELVAYMDRRNRLEELLENIQSSRPDIEFEALPGKGLESAALAERFDAIIWASAKSSILTVEGIVSRRQAVRNLDDIYRTILLTRGRNDILQEQPKRRDEAVRHVLTRQRTLLVVDNLETVHIDDEDVLTFLRELPAPTKAIVTTRHRIDVAYPVRLEGMPWEHAKVLIDQESDSKQVELSENDSRRLYDLTGGLPLAIVWSIGQMGVGLSQEATLRRLEKPTDDLGRFCFEGAVAQIKGTPAYDLLLALSLCAPDASRRELGSIARLSESMRDVGLASLEKLSLVTKSKTRFGRKSETRFGLLPMTRRFASSCLAEEDEEVAATLKAAFIDAFLALSERHGGEKWQEYRRLDADLPNIQLALQWAYEREMWQQVGRFVDSLAELLDRRGLWEELVAYSRMAIEAGEALGNKHWVISAQVYGLGWIQARRFAKPDEGLASIESGEEEAKKDVEKYKREYALALYDKGFVLGRYFNEHQKAEALTRHSLELWEALQKPRWQIRCLGSLGSHARRQGKLDEARDKYQMAIRKARAIGDSEQAAMNLQQISRISMQQLARSIQYDELIHFSMETYGDICASLREALENYHELAIPTGISSCHYLWARAAYAAGQYAEAREQVDKASEAYSMVGRVRPIEKLEKLRTIIEQSERDRIGLEDRARALFGSQMLWTTAFHAESSS